MCSSRVADPRPCISSSARKLISARTSCSRDVNCAVCPWAASNEWLCCPDTKRENDNAIATAQRRGRRFIGIIARIIEDTPWSSLEIKGKEYRTGRGSDRAKTKRAAVDGDCGCDPSPCLHRLLRLLSTAQQRRRRNHNQQPRLRC